MAINILLPALSPTMNCGNLVKWHKKEGDFVKSGQLLAEVETDKATMEIEALDDGVLAKILVPENTMDVAVNAVIAILLEEGEEMSAIEALSQLDDGKNNNSAQPSSDQNHQQLVIAASNHQLSTDQQTLSKIFASPLAKRIATQHSLNLADIKGSGPYGRIVKADVYQHLSNSNSARDNTAAQKQILAESFIIEPHTNMRKIIASRLLESKQSIPHFYLTIDCEMDNLIQLRQQINNQLDVKISVNDFIIKAVALSMKKFPVINSSWCEEGIKKYTSIDVSVAVSIESGLVTPIVTNADNRSLSDISLCMKDLAIRARENKLKPEEFQGGGFTISNLGMFGIKSFAAIINPPQACILAVGQTVKQPVIVKDKIQIASIMQVTLSCDHRVVDGVLGANFLASFRNYLESPIQMLI